MSPQVGYGPPWRVDGPLPVRPVYGLLQAAEAPAAGVRIVTDFDTEQVDVSSIPEGARPPGGGLERWINGVEVYPYPVDAGGVQDPCAAGSNVNTKTFGSEVPHPRFAAMTAYLPVTCTTYKVWNQQEFRARALAAFAAREGSIVAREFLTGADLPLNPYLADGNGTQPIGGTAVSAKTGLAALEKAIGESGQLGLIHVSPQFASSLRELFAVDDRTGVIRTVNGNVVIPDAGYSDGATPHGSSAPASWVQEWIYATGPIDVRRSDVFVLPETVAEALERGTTGAASTGRPNSITYRAERYYLVTWDTALHVAVLVDRSL